MLPVASWRHRSSINYMDFLINIFNVVLYKPLFNLLIVLCQYLPGNDFGVAIVTLTVLSRLVLYPLNFRAIKSQKILQELQPKIQEIQNKYKNDKEKIAKATIELYQKSKINPLSGCVPILIQLPILIALYLAFQRGFRPEEMTNVYSFITAPKEINPISFGVLNLTQPNFILAIASGIAQFFQAKMTTPSFKAKTKESDFSTMMQKQMLYFFPVFTVLILWRLPSAIALYWLVTSLFSILQQYLVFKKPKYDHEERRA